jgi:hypothetical protein
MITKEQFEELGFKHQEEFESNPQQLKYWKRPSGLWLIDNPINSLFIEVVEEGKQLTEEEYCAKLDVERKRIERKWFDNNQVDFNTYDRFYSGQFPYHIVYNEQTNRLAVLYSAHTGARGVIFEGWCNTYEELELLLKMLRVNKQDEQEAKNRT